MTHDKDAEVKPNFTPLPPWVVHCLAVIVIVCFWIKFFPCSSDTGPAVCDNIGPTFTQEEE